MLAVPDFYLRAMARQLSILKSPVEMNMFCTDDTADKCKIEVKKVGSSLLGGILDCSFMYLAVLLVCFQ